MNQATFAHLPWQAPGNCLRSYRDVEKIRNSNGWNRLASVTLVVVMHGAIAAALWNYQPARDAVVDAVPIMVSWITPERPAPVREIPKAIARPAPAPAPAAMRPPIAVERAVPENQAVAETRATPVMPAQVSQPVASVATPAIAVAKTETAPVSEIIPPRFDAAYLENPPPSYPALSRRLHEKGVVLLRVMVSTGGSAERVELRASSGSPRLDGAALDAVRRWRFVPARQGAQAVSAWVLVPVSFSLEG